MNPGVLILLAILGGAAVLLGVCFVAASIPGRLRKYTTPDGAAVPESIAEWISVPIGGVRQWMAIRGRDVRNPVLLFLHGGPGSTETPFLFHFNDALTDHFTLVAWEQRGAGRSYSRKVKAESMTLRRFVDDAHEVTNYLKDRFGKDKVYLVGHSWGALVGIRAAQESPRDYHAYVGVSQPVNFALSMTIVYRWALETARRTGNRRAIRDLEGIGEPVEGRYAGGFRAFGKQLRWVRAFGGAFYSSRSIVPAAKILLLSPVYSLSGKLKWLASERFSIEHLWAAVESEDLFREVPRLGLPTYLVHGRHDYQVPMTVTQEYFQALEAPRKRLFILEKRLTGPCSRSRQGSLRS